MARVCVLLANGFEEIEAVTIIDVLRRAEIETVLVAVDGGGDVVGAHDIRLRADRALAEVSAEPWDLVVLPGGMPGSARLRDSAEVRALLLAQNARGGRIGAICAAPIALASAGLLEGRKATCYPGFADQLGGADYRTDAPVVIDGNLVTSRGPGTALPFALALVGELAGQAKVSELGRSMLAPGH